MSPKGSLQASAAFNHLPFWKSSGSPSVIPGPAAAWLGTWQKCKLLGPTQTYWIRVSGVRPSLLCVNKTSIRFWCSLKFDNPSLELNRDIEPRPGFLSLGTTDIWGWTILFRRDCPVHYKMLSSVPGLYPPGASSTLLQSWQPICLQILANVPSGAKSRLTENHWPRV